MKIYIELNEEEYDEFKHYQKDKDVFIKSATEALKKQSKYVENEYEVRRFMPVDMLNMASHIIQGIRLDLKIEKEQIECE